MKRLDNFRLCEGIETDLSILPTKPRLSLSDMAARYILDPFKGATVLRSRKCLYDVNGDGSAAAAAASDLDDEDDDSAISCHECRSARRRLANYTSGSEEAAAATAGFNDAGNDLSAFLEESMEVRFIFFCKEKVLNILIIGKFPLTGNKSKY